MQVDGFNYGQLMAIASAAKLPDGQEYADLDEFLKALCGRAVKVHLYHKDSNVKTYENIDMHSPTGFPEIRHKPKEKPATTGYAAPQTQQFASAAAPAGSDDDYPF